MNAPDSQRLVQHIRRLVGDPHSTPSDGELLHRYVVAGEEASFAALVRRHGPMVFAVCQAVLRQRDDAEDAFQAVFLVLAQKAGSIRRREGLGGWLQRVAYHIALKARAANAQRRTREARAAREPAASSCDDLTWGEVRALLHAELAALPESLRAPLVLCYLEGLTQEEAARQLGWTAATVKGRLHRGRQKLRRRLERRGVALTAALAAALAGQVLAETVVRTIRPFTVETATTAAVTLARGFLRSWIPIKLTALSVLLLPGLLVGGVMIVAPKTEEAAPPSTSAEKPADQPPILRPAVDAHGDVLPDGAIARLGTMRFNHGDGLKMLYFTPDGKTILSEGNGSIRFWDAANGKELDRIRMGKVYFEYPPTILADGKTLISLSEGIDDRDVATFWDLAEKKPIRTKELPVRRSVLSTEIRDSLSPDGKLCVMHVHTPAHVQVSDVTTGKSLYRLAKGAKTFRAVAFVDNDRLVSADDKNHLEIWEARTGKLLRQFTHEAPIRYLLASPDGRWLASLEQPPSPYGRNVEQETVYLWDMSTGNVKQSLRAKPKYWFTNVCFSPDGKTVLTSTRRPGGADQVVHWDCESGRRLLEFDAASGIIADIAAISPDGSRLAAGNRAGKFELWDLKNGQRLTSENSRHLRYASVVLAPTGERATVIGHDSISSWDATTGRHLHSFALPRGTLHLSNLSCDGRYAVTFRLDGDELQMLVWDIATHNCLFAKHFPGGYQQLKSAFSPDSSLLATRHPGKHTLVRLWDVRSGKLVRSFEESKAGWPGQMRFTADGKILFVAGAHVVGYEVASGKELFSWRLKPLPNTSGAGTFSFSNGVTPQKEDEQIGWRTLDVSSDGTRIAAILFDVGFSHQHLENRLALYDARSGRRFRRWNDSGLPTPLFEQLVFTYDGQLLASSDGHVVHLWEAATSKLIRTFKGHQGDLHALAFSRDDRRLASASSDSTILVWDVTGQPAKSAALTEAKLRECWKDLAGEDARRAHQAVWRLAGVPALAIPFLTTHLRPVKPVNREQLDRWIRDLDADAIEVRQRAATDLEKLGELAEPALRRALANKPTLEQRRRIEPLLAKLEAAIPPGEALQALRAVRALEHMGTPEARQLLSELAHGADDAGLTRAARSALTWITISTSRGTP